MNDTKYFDEVYKGYDRASLCIMKMQFEKELKEARENYKPAEILIILIDHIHYITKKLTN